jgi:hypothetical protein
MQETQKTLHTLILLSALLMTASTCFARGGPAPPAKSDKPSNTNAASSSVGASAPTHTLQNNTTATPNEADEKDINPFTGGSMSEAQLRRTLEREKLITAIASEKTKQTQSNSELQMARLRNAAEKSRLATVTKEFAPLPVAAAPPLARQPSPAKPSPSTPRAVDRGSSLSLGDSAAAPITLISPSQGAALGTRAEIRFVDELVELKPGPARNPSVVASVDTQRSADQNQVRPINPITVSPAGLPAPQVFPNASPVIPAPLQSSFPR